MKMIRAFEADGPNLAQYFHGTNLTGRVNLRLERKDSFFAHYKIQSDEYTTFMLVDEKKPGKIQAMVTMVFREAQIAGEKCKVAFVSDLRVSAKRNVILKWTQYLLPTLRDESLAHGCKHVFSVVNEWHGQAYNAFVRPRTIRRELPRYYLFRRFEAICLHGLWPFATPPLDTIQVRFARPNEFEKLAHYVGSKMGGKLLSFNFSAEQFKKNLSLRTKLQVEDFLLALDYNENIVGCTALWNPSNTQEFYSVNYDTKVATLKEALQFLSYFGMTRRLPDTGKTLNFVVMSYLLANNPDIFQSLLHKAFHAVTDDHFLIYPHFEGSLLTQPPKSFIHSQFRGGIYCVLPPEEAPPDFLKPRIIAEAPEFDLAFW